MDLYFEIRLGSKLNYKYNLDRGEKGGSKFILEAFVLGFVALKNLLEVINAEVFFEFLRFIKVFNLHVCSIFMHV